MALLGAVVLASACEVAVGVDIEVAENGSGTVSLGVSLDRAATEALGDLAGQINLDDLARAGWDVSGPAREADNRVWLRASKQFGTPEQLPSVLAEIAGPDVFPAFQLRRRAEFAEQTWEVAGRVDPAPAILEYTDSLALNPGLENSILRAISEAGGDALTDGLTIRLSIDLPGELRSGGVDIGWAGITEDSANLSVPVQMVAKAENTTAKTLRLVGMAAAALFILAVLLNLLAWWYLRRHRKRSTTALLATASSKAVPAVAGVGAVFDDARGGAGVADEAVVEDYSGLWETAAGGYAGAPAGPGAAAVFPPPDAGAALVGAFAEDDDLADLADAEYDDLSGLDLTDAETTPADWTASYGDTPLETEATQPETAETAQPAWEHADPEPADSPQLAWEQPEFAESPELAWAQAEPEPAESPEPVGEEPDSADQDAPEPLDPGPLDVAVTAELTGIAEPTAEQFDDEPAPAEPSIEPASPTAPETTDEQATDEPEPADSLLESAGEVPDDPDEEPLGFPTEPALLDESAAAPIEPIGGIPDEPALEPAETPTEPALPDDPPELGDEPVDDDAESAPTPSERSGRPARTLQLVVIGAWGVLFQPSDPVSDLLIPFLRRSGSAATVQDIREAHRRATLGRISADELWQACDLRGEPNWEHGPYAGQMTISTGATDFIRSLLRRGVGVACVTNDVSEWSWRLRQWTGFEAVTPWVISSDIGIRKPDPGVFEMLRRASDVPFANCLLIDCDIPTLDAARSLGMSTALFGTPSADQAATESSHPAVGDFTTLLRRN